MTVFNIGEIINSILSFPCVVLLTCAGLYFTIRLNFIQIKGMKKLISENMSKESLSAFATALGGTVGVGSITGIGISIAEGGAGSIFWMWISSFFGMGIKYAETYIAVKHKSEKSGGAMCVLTKAGYKKLGVAFCIITLIASLGGGNSAQSGAMTQAFSTIDVSPFAVAIISAFLLLCVLFGGKKRIEKVNSFLVPIGTVLYIVAMIYILIETKENIPHAFSSIFKNAFGIKPFSGGISAYLFTRALRTGVVRGVFSHEAGMGSSPLAHVCTKKANPYTSGLLGIAEIYVDTFIVGTLTALSLCCCSTCSVAEMFEKYFGKAGTASFAFFMAIFAFAAVLSWCYYSEVCFSFMFKNKEHMFGIYKIFAVIAFFAGCFLPLEVSFGFSDIFNCLMIYVNLFLLFIKRREIIHDNKKSRRIL